MSSPAPESHSLTAGGVRAGGGSGEPILPTGSGAGIDVSGELLIKVLEARLAEEIARSARLEASLLSALAPPTAQTEEDAL